MRHLTNLGARWAAGLSATLLIQDRLGGLDIAGWWLVAITILLVVALVILLATWEPLYTKGAVKVDKFRKKTKQTVRGDKNISLQDVQAGRDVIAAHTVVQVANLTTIPDPVVTWEETMKNEPATSF